MTIDQIYNEEPKTQSDDPVPMGRYELMERVKELEAENAKLRAEAIHWQNLASTTRSP